MNKKQATIPLVRAAFIRPFEIAMRNNGVSPGDYFEKVGFPHTNDYAPDSLLPEKPFWKLINLVASQENMPDFGIRVAQSLPWHRIDSIVPLIQASCNLEALLVKFCEIASNQSNTSRFLLERIESRVFFSSDTQTLFDNDQQMELYRVASMIQLVQLAAGSSWNPESIDLQMNRSNSFPLSPYFKRSQLRFSQARTRLSIPTILLKLPVNLEIKTTVSASPRYDISADFVATLKQLIEIYAASGTCRVEMIADVAGMSVRSLQRKLKETGLSFNHLLNQARYELAQLKLQDSASSITRIASELGYTDSAHFTRAFRRWSGVSPREFRSRSN